MPHLFVDANNVQGQFIPIPGWKKMGSLSAIKSNARRKIRSFASACNRFLQLTPVFVFDEYRSHEERQVWRSRRENELHQGKKNVIYGADRLVAELLVEAGLRVAFITKVDCDEWFVARALAEPDSRILTADTDVFRYNDGALIGRVYRQFNMKEKNPFILQKLTSPVKRTKAELVVIKLPLDDPRYEWPDGDAMSPNTSSIPFRAQVIGSEPLYIRGVISERDNLLPHSLHRFMQRYRAIAYAATGVSASSAVVEEYPYWDTDHMDVTWYRGEVLPDYDTKMPSVAEIHDALLAYIGEHAPKLLQDRTYRIVLALLASEYPAIVATPEPLDPVWFEMAMSLFSDSDDSSIAVRKSCSECRKNFEITKRDEAFFLSKGWSLPKRCKPCRDMNKMTKRMKKL